MDFALHVTYSEEQQQFRQEVRAWLEKNIPEEMKTPVSFHDYTLEMHLFRCKKANEMGEKGWLYPLHPKEYGGGGLTVDHAIIIDEELDRARFDRPYNPSQAVEVLLVWGTEEQKQKFLVPMLKGEKTCFQKLTEPHSGADLADYQSRAVRDGDDWLLTGSNVFIGSAYQPDLLFGPMLTDPDAPRHRNLGYFAIPVPSPGLTMREMHLLGDERKQAIFMENVRVPADHLIGGDHQGWQVLGTHLEFEHGGGGQAFSRNPVVENLLAYAKDTERDTKPLVSDPVLQQTAMDAYIESHVNSLLGQRTSWMYQNRMHIQSEGALHNLHGRLSTLSNAIRVREVMGMYALLGAREPGAPHGGAQEIAQRDSERARHGAGATAVHKVIIARRLGISRTQERAAPTPSTTATHGS
jgi:alkylation response protein AidB-like acyl-CoA dehydrogenase